MKFFEQFLASLFEIHDEQIFIESADELKISKSQFLCDVSSKSDWISEFFSPEEITLSGRPSLENLQWLLASIAAGKIVNIVADDVAMPSNDLTSSMKSNSMNFEQSIQSLRGKFNDLARHVELVLLTSGSTGAPNKVRLGFAEFCYQAIVVGNDLQLDQKDRQLFYMPLNYVYGLSVAMSGIFRNSILVETAHTLEEPNSFFEQITRRNITCFSGVPFTYNLLIKKWGIDKLKKSSLKMLSQAGGVLGVDVKRLILDELPNINLWIMYGQTELGGRITQFNLSKNKDKMLAAGVPIHGVEIYIEHLDDTADSHSEGEVFVYSASCAINAKDKNRYILKDDKIFIGTGDIGFYKDGYLYINGRNKNFVKVAGSRINLASVENYFKSLSEVTEAVVEYEDKKFPLLLIGVHFSELNTEIKDQASIKSKFQALNGFKEGLSSLIRNIPYYIYVFDGVIPRLSSNKINSVLLKEKLRERYREKGSIYIRL